MTALFRAKQYQTFAAFTEMNGADSFRDELQTKGIDAITVKQVVSDRDEASALGTFEVQVASAHFGEACKHLRAAGWAKTPRQFTLRAVLIGVTIVCVLSALVRQFGLSATFWAMVFIPLGGLAMIWGIVFVRRGRASWRWSQTRGTISQSYIDWDGENYSPKINYRFSVGGQEYVVDTVSYMSIDVGGARTGHQLARRRVVRYPVGLEVNVFYDPMQPVHAVLERGARIRDGNFLVAGGLAFIVIGLLLLFGVVRA